MHLFICMLPFTLITEILKIELSSCNYTSYRKSLSQFQFLFLSLLLSPALSQLQSLTWSRTCSVMTLIQTLTHPDCHVLYSCLPHLTLNLSSCFVSCPAVFCLVSCLLAFISCFCCSVCSQITQSLSVSHCSFFLYCG